LQEHSSNIASLLSGVVSLFFVILVVYEAQRGKENDLINKRKKLRNIFTYTVSVIVLLTLMGELSLKNNDQEIPKLIQRLSILVFSTYFLLQNTHWKGFFFIEKSNSVEIKDHELIDLIQQKMIEGDFYSQENLTIKKLAESLNEQEYIIRQAINQQLSYQNFTDFLNSYRITEAKNILSDSTQKKKTVLEIAYKVGFNSIGPFNRAFKKNTRLTPTDFRKKHLSDT
jgi:YesN/AraC family two-component response regulator